jgi:hypothetical protein
MEDTRSGMELASGYGVNTYGFHDFYCIEHAAAFLGVDTVLYHGLG